MQFEKNGWIIAGLIFGLFDFIFVTYGTAYLIGQEINWLSYAIGIPLWTITGLAWGYYMKRYMMKQRLNKEKAEAGKNH